MPRLVDLGCAPCAYEALDEMLTSALVMQAQWCRPDVVVVRGDGSEQTWHEPVGLSFVLMRDPLINCPN